MSTDPTRPVTLPGYLGALERRVSEIERSNPIGRASWHDGTRTRGGIGVFAHPDGGEQTGAVFYDTAGDVLLLVDDSELTLTETAITGRPAVAAAATDYVLISDTSDGANLKKALVSSIGGGPSIGTATIDTSNDLNDGTTSRRTITAGTLGAGWSIATNALTYTGTPGAVLLEVNVSYTSVGQLAAPVVELWKGATKMAMAHTGYIRNASGHNQSSSNFTFIDTSPGTNPAYHIESSRGSTTTDAATPLTPSQFAAYVFS